MKNTFAISWRLALMLAGTLLTVSAEPNIILNQSFPVGKKLHQSTTIDQTMKMGGPEGAPAGQGVPENKITTRMDMSMDIQKHDNNQKKAIIKFDKYVMVIDAGGFKKEFSSDDDGDNPFSTLDDKEFTVIFDKDGRVQSVKDGDKLLEGLAEGPGAFGMMSPTFSSEQLQQTIHQSLLQDVPDNSIEIGDSWPFEMETPMPQGGGDMKLSGTYTLKSFDDFEGNRVAVIAMDGKLESDSKVGVEMNGQKVEVGFGEFELEGEIHFDNELGLPRKTSMLTKMEVVMDFPQQKMTMNIDTATISQITEVEDSTP